MDRAASFQDRRAPRDLPKSATPATLPSVGNSFSAAIEGHSNEQTPTADAVAAVGTPSYSRAGVHSGPRSAHVRLERRKSDFREGNIRPSDYGRESASLVNLLARRMGYDKTLKECPDLEPGDIQACLEYGGGRPEEVLPHQAQF